jgi:hypothetical protein
VIMQHVLKMQYTSLLPKYIKQVSRGVLHVFAYAKVCCSKVKRYKSFTLCIILAFSGLGMSYIEAVIVILFTRAVRKVSSHFEYLENSSRGLDVTWQPVRGDLTVHP